MSSAVSDAVRWTERIARARRLADEHEDAAAILTFYAALATYQESLLKKGSDPIFTQIVNPATGDHEQRPLFEIIDITPVLAAIPDFLSWLQQRAPAPLAATASEMCALDRSRWAQILDGYLNRDPDVTHATEPAGFVIEVLLQPFAERLAKSDLKPQTGGPDAESPIPRSRSRCPNCHGDPVLGLLREEGHGAKRTLLCGLCLTEQNYLRVVCLRCDEQRFDALPVYTADRFGHVRIEACDGCRTYLKTIDLTKDGTAVPVVDDLASVSLDLWARDRGYERLRPNLLRL